MLKSSSSSPDLKSLVVSAVDKATVARALAAANPMHPVEPLFSRSLNDTRPGSGSNNDLNGLNKSQKVSFIHYLYYLLIVTNMI